MLIRVRLATLTYWDYMTKVINENIWKVEKCHETSLSVQFLSFLCFLDAKLQTNECLSSRLEIKSNLLFGVKLSIGHKVIFVLAKAALAFLIWGDLMVLAECILNLNLISFYDKMTKLGKKQHLSVCSSVWDTVVLQLFMFVFLFSSACLVFIFSVWLSLLPVSIIIHPARALPLFPCRSPVKAFGSGAHLSDSRSVSCQLRLSVCSGVFLQPATISYCFSASVTRGAERFLFLVHNHIVS